MKRKLASGLILSLLLTAYSRGAGQSSPIIPSNQRIPITIGVYNYAHAKSELVFAAQQTTAAILMKAGVDAEWLTCPTDRASTRNPACAATSDPMHFTLRILSDSMSSRWRPVSGDTVGYAVVGEEPSCDAWILYDRARDFAAAQQLTLASVLGAVIAHELGHLLLGENTHSKAGLMQARWSSEELLAIECGQLVFSVAESERIHRAVIARRQARSAAAVAQLSSFGPQSLNSPSSIADLTRRAESGDSAAMQYLVNFLLQADGLASGYDVAQAWVRSAVARNDPNAQFLLGYFYELGRGVPRDYAKAAESYQRAALQRHPVAQNNLAGLYRRGLGVHKDTTRAFRLFLAAAQQGLPAAEWNLGHAYYEGIGTPRDFSQAARWFRAAAELGDPKAQHDLAILYLKGQGLAADYVEGARWELLAAQQGDADAEADLAYLYETGKGVPLNYVAAYAWYSRAAAAGQNLVSERRKSLSHAMTARQLTEANHFFETDTVVQ